MWDPPIVGVIREKVLHPCQLALLKIGCWADDPCSEIIRLDMHCNSTTVYNHVQEHCPTHRVLH
jgi:hypothetical protein